jgi:hypothetical protein
MKQRWGSRLWKQRRASTRVKNSAISGSLGEGKQRRVGPLANIQQWHPSQQRAAFQAIAITTPRQNHLDDTDSTSSCREEAGRRRWRPDRDLATKGTPPSTPLAAEPPPDLCFDKFSYRAIRQCSVILLLLIFASLRGNLLRTWVLNRGFTLLLLLLWWTNSCNGLSESVEAKTCLMICLR